MLRAYFPETHPPVNFTFKFLSITIFNLQVHVKCMINIFYMVSEHAPHYIYEINFTQTPRS